MAGFVNFSGPEFYVNPNELDADRDEDPVGSLDYWPAESATFFFGSRINKFKLKMLVYKIEFYAYLPKILIFFFISK